MYSSQVASARPLSLSESVKMAMNKDESIMAAQASQEGAKWSLSAARRQKGLTLNWSSQALRIGGLTSHTKKIWRNVLITLWTIAQLDKISSGTSGRKL